MRVLVRVHEVTAEEANVPVIDSYFPVSLRFAERQKLVMDHPNK